MAKLILGPLLRWAGGTRATVWVETDAPAEVEVRGRPAGGAWGRARTFQVAGHHYGLVLVEGLEPGKAEEYAVALDGEPAWPEPGSRFPPSRIRTYEPGEPLRIAFGSCRVAVPHEPPWTLPPGRHKLGRGADALHAFALRMKDVDPDDWPHLLLLLGDQVYADDTSPGVQEFIRSRRDPAEPPGEEVADFEEYAHLYWEAWGDPVLRWLLSTVPTAMIFDDHDVHDDWNTSAAWVAQMRAEPWWDERITSGLASYWLYQHVGNLSPEDLEDDPVWPRVRGSEDATAVLREHAFRADREVAGTRWSYRRDLGRVRLVAIDSRCGRVLEPGRREMVDDEEWDWVVQQSTGDFDHLLLASSLPFLLAPATHDLEAWNEAVCDGAWGRLAARMGEQLRQAIDLEHWAAFNGSFDRLAALVADVAAGRRGAAPASVVALSGDVHHTYLAELAFPGERDVRSRAWQAVCSPLRNPLPAGMRAAHRRTFRRPAALAARRLARLARVPPEAVTWRVVEGPCFDNHLGLLELDGRSASLRVERAVTADDGRPAGLEPLYEHRLAGGSGGLTPSPPVDGGSGGLKPSPPVGRGLAMSAEGTLVGLARWPVKSMAGERLRAARLDGRGLGGDRTHALLDADQDHDGRLLTARRAPRLLAWAAAYPEAPDDALDPAAPPSPSVRAPDGTLWAWEDPGLAAAIRADVGMAVRPRREVAGQQDLERSVLVTTEASRRALEAALGRPVDLRRFRTNLHLDLDAPAFAEERWEGGRLRVGQVTLALLHPCARCVIPTRDPDDQGRWPELLRHLHRARAGLFGINARVLGGGRVALGDPVTLAG